MIKFFSDFTDPDYKSKWEYPYNYSPIVQFQRDGNASDTVYTDHLYRWDSKKHDALCIKHFGNCGQYWDHRSPEKIEAFIRDWLEDQTVILVSVTEYCNQATGYPCWRFDYQQKPTI